MYRLFRARSCWSGVILTNNFGITIKLWFFILLLSNFWRNDQRIFVNVTTVLFSCHVLNIPSYIVIRKGFKMKWIFHRFSIVIEKGCQWNFSKMPFWKMAAEVSCTTQLVNMKQNIINYFILGFFIQARCCYVTYAMPEQNICCFMNKILNRRAGNLSFLKCMACHTCSLLYYQCV